MTDFVFTRINKHQRDMTRDPELAEQMAREAAERDAAEAAAVQRRADLLAWAAKEVEDPPPVRVLKMFEQREEMNVLFPAVALALEKAEDALATLEAEYTARVKPGDVFRIGQFRDRLEPLQAAVKEARERYAVCREVATARVEAALRTLINMQVPQVVDHLKRAVGPDDRIRKFEEAFGHFGIPHYGSKSFGVARLLRVRAAEEDTTSS